MAPGTTLRLDTAELAMEFGWYVESSDHTDEFSRADVTITAHYSAADEIDSAVKKGPGVQFEDMEHRTFGRVELLRYWLTGRPAESTVAPAGSASKIPPHLSPKPGDWTRDEFVAAVEDPSDRAFLLRLMDLVDENSRLPSLGMHIRLYFGKRPGGAMFVYPFGRRFPPFKFSISGGRLMVSGCWTGFSGIKGHPGFADLAAMLNLDEKGPAKAVAVAGLDPDEVWQVGETVSRAING
ncbi:hypothetical protein [Mycobacterium sp. M26]|uniref:hypothetical protein n=1 Tax=Mycobacterium sp. M26 TaxID=1762962 RepID=UPI000A6C212B|nr:hypothetical protein [Mycobacterium sp. M26]